MQPNIFLKKFLVRYDHKANMAFEFGMMSNGRFTSGRWQSRTLLTIDERGSKIARNRIGRQMAIENSVSNDFLSTFVDSITFFDCHLPDVRFLSQNSTLSFNMFNKRKHFTNIESRNAILFSIFAVNFELCACLAFGPKPNIRFSMSKLNILSNYELRISKCFSFSIFVFRFSSFRLILSTKSLPLTFGHDSRSTRS